MKYSIESLINDLDLTEEQVSKLLKSDDNSVKKVEHSAVRPTTIEELKSYQPGIVRLPDFAEGQPLIAKVGRPSMLKLAASGKIPNSLLTTASKLFTGGSEGLDSSSENMLKDMYDVCMVMADATLIEPSIKDIESAGLSLTDEQLMAIFNYTQSGIKALDNFR